jgi:hypothetical protein
MTDQTEHKKDCPTQIKPPRKPGICTCGVNRDKWLRTYAQLAHAMKKTP